MAILRGARPNLADPKWLLATFAVVVLAAVYIWSRTYSPTVPALEVGRPAPAAAAPRIERRAAAVPPAVAAYTRYADSLRAAGPAGPARDETAEGLRRLAAAIEAVGAGDSTLAPVVARPVQALRARADSVGARRPDDAQAPARHAREAARLAADALQIVRGARDVVPASPADLGPADAVRPAAEAIRADRPLDAQGDAVRRLFSAAAAALRAITTAG